MPEKLKSFITSVKPITLILIAMVLLFLGGGYFVIQKFFVTKQEIPFEEVQMTFNPDGPYALLLPRRDGNAINLNLKRISSFKAFSYQLSYPDISGIERGAGNLNTWIPIEAGKGEFTQELLFGTCSKGDTFSTLHCVFDKGVENGTLILHFKDEHKIYKVTITWHFQKPDIALGILDSVDGHFSYITKAATDDLKIVGFTTINPILGIPKLPSGKKVSGEVYALNVPIAKSLPQGQVMIELSSNPPSNAKIGYYKEERNKWMLLDAKIEGSKLSASANGDGIFAVIVDGEKPQ